MKPWFVLCCALLLAGLLSSTAQASSFTVGDIRLQGLQRVSAGTVFNVMPVEVGDTIDQDDVRDVIRSLFNSGYFRDVRAARDGNTLVIIMAERPAIDSISLSGNRQIPTDALMGGLEAQGLSEGEIFRQATLERIGIELERQYVAQGRYGATIETEIDELPRNRVAISINITEGQPSGIRHINIVGNESFSNERLLDIMELKHPNWLSWMRNDDKYSREKLSGDIERIESFYQDRGFVEFQIESVQVSITPDREQVYVTINIDEGDVYEVGSVELMGDFKDVDPDLLRPLLVVASGQTFSRALLTASEERITNALGNSGYTFATASGIPETNDDGTVDVRFFVDAGQRAYVRRVEFSGNSVTRDEVLRREMRQMEGGWANTALIELSKLRLERLGFFQEINVETPEVPGTENQVDVLFSVEEAPSGSISATLGFAQGTGLVLGANYSETNFMGTGNSVNLGIDWTRFQQSLSFNYLNPYFTLDGISRGFNFFYQRVDFGRQDLADFNTESYGAGVTFGVPLSETQRFNFGGTVENTDIPRSAAHPPEIVQFLDREGRSTLNYKARANWVSSTLNRAIFPTRGHSQGINLEVAVPGSDLNFFKLGYNNQFYFPITGDYVLRLRSRVAYGDAYGDTERLPFYEHYFSGGFGSVRGFQRSTLGPRSTQAVIDVGGPVGPPQLVFSGPPEGRPFGGNLLVEGSFELIFPMPFVEDRRSVRPVLFVDAGNVFNTNCPEVSVNCFDFDVDEFRYSVGVGVSWLTGMGPMTFSYARPFNRGPFDRVERFQFELGRTF